MRRTLLLSLVVLGVAAADARACSAHFQPGEPVGICNLVDPETLDLPATSPGSLLGTCSPLMF